MICEMGTLTKATYSVPGGRPLMEQKMEREGRLIVCPEWKEKTMIMCEWNIVSEGANILQRTLQQIDCYNPRLSELGGTGCNWACEKAIAKVGTIRSGLDVLLVCAILAAGILWIAFYNLYISPYLHLYGLFLFIGVPVFMGLMLYYSRKVMIFLKGRHGETGKEVKGAGMKKYVLRTSSEASAAPQASGRSVKPKGCDYRVPLEAY